MPGFGDERGEGARTLGDLVARGLIARLRLPVGVDPLRRIRLDRLKVDVTAMPGESDEQLAERIVDQVAARIGGAR